MRERHLMNTVATMLQSTFRGIRDRKHYRVKVARRQRENEASYVIQRCFHARVAKNRVEKKRVQRAQELLNRKVLRVQTLYRGWRARVLYCQMSESHRLRRALEDKSAAQIQVR